MSRARKPIEQQKGNLTVLQQEQRKYEQSLATGSKKSLESKKPPSTLINTMAATEYKRIIEELKKLDIICDMDINNIVGYCNAFSNYQQATEELQNQSFVLKKETQYGSSYYKNPLIGVQRDYAEEMRKFASLCGMSIDSRLKLASVKASKTDEEINKRFGGI